MALILTSKNDTEKESFTPASTFIALLEYDPKNQTCDITFHSGTKIRYNEFYPNTWESFKRAQNHSVFYSRLIKGNFQTSKIISADIGRQKSTPIKHISREGTLDSGIRKQRSRDERERAGTVDRAFAGAAAE